MTQKRSDKHVVEIENLKSFFDAISKIKKKKEGKYEAIRKKSYRYVWKSLVWKSADQFEEGCRQ